MLRNAPCRPPRRRSSTARCCLFVASVLLACLLPGAVARKPGRGRRPQPVADDGHGPAPGDLDEVEPTEFVSIAEEQYLELKRKAHRPAVAQLLFHKHFPPWSEPGFLAHLRRVAALKGAAQGNASAGVGEEEAEDGEADREGGGGGGRRLAGAAGASQSLRFVRFVKAAAQAYLPTPAVATCMNLAIDLTSLGFPGVILSLGLSGELQYNLCSSCFKWSFAAQLSFNFGFEVFGYGVFFRLTLTGRLDLAELQCTMAKDSNFCKYLYIVLPAYLNRMLDRDTRCYSDSPFDVIEAYIKFQWYSVQYYVQSKFYGKDHPEYIGSPLERNLQKIEAMLKKYPPLFRVNRPTPAVAGGILCSLFGCPPTTTTTSTPSPVTGVVDPFRVQLNGQATWIWVVTFEARLCMAGEVPLYPQGGDRGDKLMVALRYSCLNSIRLDDLSPDLSDVTVAGSTLSLPFRRSRAAQPLQFQFATPQQAQAWRSALVAFVAQLRRGYKDLLVAACVDADLTGTYDVSNVAGYPSPYCTLEVPGQIWASSHADPTLTPAWNESIGLRIASTANGSLVINVAVRDVMDNKLQSFWQWATIKMTNLVGKVVDNAADPLTQYLGKGRVMVCKQGGSSVWRTISSSRGCMTNSEGIAMQFFIKTKTLQQCMEACENIERCAAVDWYDAGYIFSDMRCNIFTQACTTPSKWYAAAYSLDRLGCDVVHRMGDPPQLVDVSLYAPTTLADYFLPCCWAVPMLAWNLWSAISGTELKQQARMRLRLHYLPRNWTAPAWVPEEITTPGASFSTPGLVEVSQAMFAALDMWQSKLPEYSNQVRRRVREFTGSNGVYEDQYLTYDNLDGRFFARWSPFAADKAAQQEGGTTTTRSPQAWPCPPPPDAGTINAMHCEYDHMSSTNSFWSLIKDDFAATFREPVCSKAPLSDPSVDERVVDFSRAMKQSRNAQDPRKAISFNAEVATSLLNLFVRVVSDVHALWAIYFADDPNWDGGCYSASPGFNLPYEFGPDYTDGNELLWAAVTQNLAITQWPTSRSVRLASQEGETMADADNPFCQWPWASERVGQNYRIDFLRQHAPRSGRDGFVSAPRDLSGQMWPHLWCEVLKEYRNQTNGSRTTSERGMLLRYRSSCQQIRRVRVDGKDNETASKTWRRYDCESVAVTAPFISMFPKFFTATVGDLNSTDLAQMGWFGALGTVVEDVLQCAGRISPSMRQFPRRAGVQNIDELCDCSERHYDILDRASGTQFDQILAFVRAQANVALATMRQFVDFLADPAVGSTLTDDFKRLWSYYDLQDDGGTRLTGEAWQRGLDRARELLGTDEAISERIEYCKEQAVLAAWDELGDGEKRITALFPVPVQYRSTLEMSIGFSTELANLCDKGIPQQLTLAVKWINEGRTWQYFTPSQNTVCVQGTLAPLPFVALAFTAEGCWRFVDGELETTWRFDISAVLRQRVVGFLGMASQGVGSLTEGMADQAAAAGQIADQDVDLAQQSIAWQVARRILMDPKLLLNALSSSSSLFNNTGGLAAGAVRQLAESIRRNAVFIAVDVARYAIKFALSAAESAETQNPFFDLKKKEIDMLRIGVELSKLGSEGQWRKSFNSIFLRRGSLGFKVDVPEAMTVEADISLTTQHDLSQVFDVLFDMNALPTTYYDCCVMCLQRPGAAFCLLGPGAPSCIGANASCSGSLIFKVTKCGTQPQGGGKPLERSLRQDMVCVSPSDYDTMLTFTGGSTLGMPGGADGLSTTTATSTTTTTTFAAPTVNVTAAPYQAVCFHFTVANLDYTNFAAHAGFRTKFRLAVQEVVAGESGPGVYPAQVLLDFSPGSVLVDVKVATPDASTRDTAIKDALAASTALGPKLLARIQALPGLAAIASGPVDVVDISAPEIKTVSPDPMFWGRARRRGVPPALLCWAAAVLAAAAWSPGG